MSNFIHESSYIEDNVLIGKNTKIWYFCHVSSNVVIGNDCNIGQNIFVDSSVKIGNKVKIQNNVSIYSGVEIQDNVFLGPSCVFTNVINPRSFIERKHEILSTIVSEGATIGANATIICGLTIGKYSMVGAGTVVTKNVPDYALVVGVPSKIIGYVCKCGNRLVKNNEQFNCNECNRKYKLNKTNLEEVR